GRLPDLRSGGRRPLRLRRAELHRRAEPVDRDHAGRRGAGAVPARPVAPARPAAAAGLEVPRRRGPARGPAGLRRRGQRRRPADPHRHRRRAGRAARGRAAFNAAWTVFLLPWAVLAGPLATAVYPTLSAADDQVYAGVLAATARS